MSIFDFLKRKKEVEKAKVKKPEKVLVTKEVKPLQGRTLQGPTLQYSAKKQKGSFSYNIVKEPHISEKATNLAEDNKYVFKVYDKTNKPEIKKSVEGIYGVDVLSVNIIKIPAKKRRLGRTEGFRKRYSKAIVTIKEGQKIEIL